ncbi:MAG: hypothetical protein ACKO6F_03875 [Cyanobium sp.]
MTPASPAPAQRLDGVLKPVISELGSLVRATPGTLSLAQGMVGRGPPREVLATLVAAGKAAGAADPTRDAYGPVQGDPELLAMLAAALGQEQGIDLHGGDLWVMAGSNMASTLSPRCSAMVRRPNPAS